MDSLLTYVRRCYALLPPADRRRWLKLIPLVALTSAIEAVGTVAIFVLVAALTDPEAVFEMPLLGPLLAEGVGDDRQRVGVVLVILVAIFYVAKSAVVAATEYAQAVAAAHTASNLSVRMVTAYLRAPYLFHVGRNASDLVHTATVVAGTSFGSVVSAMLHIVTEVLVFVAILAVLFLAAPGMTVAATAFLLVVGALFVVGIRRTSSRLGERVQKLSVTGMRQQAQALSAVDEIAVLGRSGHFIERFADLSGKLAEIEARSRFIASLPRITIETLFICGALCVTVGLIVMGETGPTTVSLLGLFAYAGFRIIPSANRILMHIHTVRFGQAGVEQIRSDLAETETEHVDPPVDPDWDFTEEVSFQKVALTYPDTTADVLREVDLTIRHGESLAIVGETGSGKSSLIRLLVGLLPPTRGRITIDGAAFVDVLPSWRRRLGYIPQEVHLVEDSLRRNIAFGIADREIDDAAVLRALGRAQLGSFLAGLPDGLDTRVGDRGVRLSGGERQRVGIARALYPMPHVLILDEATSSLDSRTEAEVLDELRSDLEEWTVVAVTHRVESVRGFDRIVFIDGGRVSAVGTYDELAQDVEGFRRIVRIGLSE